MTKEEFIKSIQDLGIDVTEEKLVLLEKYKDILKEYNEHTNLTSITNDEDIYLKHFYDSLTIIKCVDLNNVQNIIDVGTGAGFPGMVLKIFFPHLEVSLLDSNNKKTNFLKYLSKELAVEVEIINDRVENFAKNNLNKYDLVVSRAVANLRVLSEICLPLVQKNKLFVALKGNLDETKENSLDTILLMHGKIIHQETFDLFNKGNRNIIVIQKEENTELNELRSYDKILKKPLKKNIK